MKTQTLKGFKDYLPAESLKRQFVLQKIISVFQKFGFDPLETPTLEYEQTLTGKYGEEEKLIYKFTTPGRDKVALKYDLTVPLARVVAQYGPGGEQALPIPFKRYQIQSVYRGENPQKGRYREFLQCDADIIGSSSLLADAEILALVFEIYKELALSVIIKINDRALLTKYETKALSAIDKLNKTGEERVIEELKKKGYLDAKEILEEVKTIKKSENLAETESYYLEMGYTSDSLLFDPTLVRGLDYYTGSIIEVVLKKDQSSPSLGGGGRYDKLIGQFSGSNLPAVGFSVGLDRTIEAMEEEKVLNVPQTNSKVLVTLFSPEFLNKSLRLTSSLREKNINAELWLDKDNKLDRQLKYADQKGIPYCIIIGPDEVTKGLVTLKNMRTQTQETTTLDSIIQKLSS